MVVPPPKMLQGTLRKITETLARALADPSEPTPDWTDFEWIAARAVAAMHGVSPLLSISLRWKAPDSWTRFLSDQRNHTANRHARIESLLRILDACATASKVPVLALKGAALHAMELYAAGERPMADIDLLVRPIDAEKIAATLKSLGYRESPDCCDERVFKPVTEHAPDTLGEHADNDLKVELHERISARLPWRIVDATAEVFPPQPRVGLNAYASNTSLMIHLLLHAAGSMPSKILRLVQLHDIALLSARMSELDWNLLLEAAAGGRLWWAFPPLKLTSRYYAGKIPVRVLEALGRQCAFMLRRGADHRSLYEVSLSYLWVDAFPGIEWSQSFSEAFEYAASRLRPNANQLAARERLAETEMWAHQDEWAALSQSRRIFKWIASRPTRPVTMHAVSAALAFA
jgi:hypothetical protein